jgi:hypothetical protein
MMSRHLATAAAVALCLTVPVPAFAAKAKPKPVCLLITDKADDAGPLQSAAGPQTSDPALDVVSADIAADATRLSVVWRVKKLSSDPSASAAGRRWLTTFNVGPNAVVLQVSTGPAGTNWEAGATGVLDTAKNEIRMTVPLKQIYAAKISKGTLLQKLSVHTDAGVTTDHAWGVGNNLPFPFVSPSDEASSAKTYVVGTPSCVAIGK